MDKDLLIISNIIIPTITGLFFFIYFIYFIMINQSKAASFKYFIIFLISFSFFLLGRPMQLLLGLHPNQLIIVNIRVFIFFSICITSIMTASIYFDNKPNKKTFFLIFFTGTFLGMVYVVFNTLGTTGSYEVFTWGTLKAHDTLTPAFMKPYYAREVTIFVQVLVGFLLLISSSLKIITSKAKQTLLKYLKNKNFLFNSGIFLFALSFIIGSFTKQWWLYYFVSMFSAFLFGAGVLIDIKEVYNNFERLVPFIKEDIIQNVAFSKFSKMKLIEMLRCLGKKSSLDTFIIIMMKNVIFETNYELKLFNTISKIIKKKLDALITSNNYILIPMDNQKIGIVINLLNNSYYSKNNVLELLEMIQNEIIEKTDQETAIGIGRSYQDIEDLRTSYYEAQDAQQYAARLDNNTIIHVDNIQYNKNTQHPYPVKEKARLLSCIKVGTTEECRSALKDFLKEFKLFIKYRPDSLKLRLYELIGAFIDSAIISSGNEKELNKLIKDYFNDINFISDLKTAEKWLNNLIDEITSQMAKNHKTHRVKIIENAKIYISENYNKKISYKDVAKEIFISSSYFLAMFKQETGMTFVDYLTDYRINKSKELLIKSSMSITEIAFEVGINNPNYFSSVFKKITGISAKEYRKSSLIPEPS